MSQEKKGMPIDQARAHISKLEEEYSSDMDALGEMEKELREVEKNYYESLRKVSDKRRKNMENLQKLTIVQNQFFRGLIDIQNKQLAEINKKTKSPIKEVSQAKKSTRRDNVAKQA